MNFELALRLLRRWDVVDSSFKVGFNQIHFMGDALFSINFNDSVEEFACTLEVEGAEVLCNYGRYVGGAVPSLDGFFTATFPSNYEACEIFFSTDPRDGVSLETPLVVSLKKAAVGVVAPKRILSDVKNSQLGPLVWDGQLEEYNGEFQYGPQSCSIRLSVPAHFSELPEKMVARAARFICTISESDTFSREAIIKDNNDIIEVWMLEGKRGATKQDRDEFARNLQLKDIYFYTECTEIWYSNKKYLGYHMLKVSFSIDGTLIGTELM